MLRLLVGDAGSGKTTAAVEAIRKSVESGVPTLLLVPEQETVTAETLLWDTLPPEATLTFEVTNFRRLANTAFRELGGLSYRYATPDTKALLMYRSLCRLEPCLSSFKKAPDKTQVRKFLDALRELHYASISTEKMEQVLQSTAPSAMRSKLEDLLAVRVEYESALATHYKESELDLDELAKRSEEARYFAGKAVFVDSFSSFTGQQTRLLSIIMEQTDLTVTLSLPPDAEEMLCFDELLDTKQRLLDLASERGVPTEIIDLGYNKRQKNPTLSYICRHLWRIDKKGEREEGEPLRPAFVSMVAEDPFEAALYVAADIRRRVEGGYRYGDFAVVCANAGAYAGVLDAELIRSAIPCFLSQTTPLSSYEPIKLILSAYAALSGGWRRSDLLPYLKCLCGTAEADRADRFALYVETWGLDGQDFVTSKPWNMNPNGFDKHKTPHDESIIAEIEETRGWILTTLEPLREVSVGPHTVRCHSEALYRFLRLCRVPERLEQTALRLRKCGEEACARDTERLWDHMMDLLDRAVETMGEDPVTLKTYAELLTMSFEQSSMGQIPPARDQVLIGSASTLRAGDRRVVYLFGVCDGEFPSVASPSGLFADAERTALRNSGLPLPPTEERAVTGGLYAFYRALSLPSEEAVAVRFRYSTSHSTKNPSPALVDIGRMGRVVLAETDVSDLPEQTLYYAPESAIHHLSSFADPTLGSAMEQVLADSPLQRERARIAALPLLNDRLTLSPQVSRSLHGDQLSLSQSSIEQFVKCPFSSYGDYTLRLHKNARAVFQSNHIGDFVHAVLERFFKAWTKTPHNFGEESDRKEFARGIARTYLSSLFPADRQPEGEILHLIERLCSIASVIMEDLIEEMQCGRFVPFFFELPIGYESKTSAPSLEVTTKDGVKVKLKGRIDRVDAFRRGDDLYLRVVDYKTGSKTFQESDLDEGINLQLLLYLASLLEADQSFRARLEVEQNGRILPAGVLYYACLPPTLSLSAPLSEEELRKQVKGKMSRSGLFLLNEEVLAAMDLSQDHRFLPLVKAKDPKNNPPKNLKTEKEWQELFDRLKQKVSEISERMLAGHIEAMPLIQGGKSSVCEWCAYRHLCRNTHPTQTQNEE